MDRPWQGAYYQYLFRHHLWVNSFASLQNIGLHTYKLGKWSLFYNFRSSDLGYMVVQWLGNKMGHVIKVFPPQERREGKWRMFIMGQEKDCSLSHSLCLHIHIQHYTSWKKYLGYCNSTREVRWTFRKGILVGDTVQWWRNEHKLSGRVELNGSNFYQIRPVHGWCVKCIECLKWFCPTCASVMSLAPWLLWQKCGFLHTWSSSHFLNVCWTFIHIIWRALTVCQWTSYSYSCAPYFAL